LPTPVSPTINTHERAGRDLPDDVVDPLHRRIGDHDRARLERRRDPERRHRSRRAARERIGEPRALDHHRRAPDLDRLTERDRERRAGWQAAALDPSPVRALEVLDREGSIGMQAKVRVLAGDRSIVDPHVRVLAAAEHERTRDLERSARVRLRGEEDQPQRCAAVFFERTEICGRIGWRSFSHPGRLRSTSVVARIRPLRNSVTPLAQGLRERLCKPRAGRGEAEREALVFGVHSNPRVTARPMTKCACAPERGYTKKRGFSLVEILGAVAMVTAVGAVASPMVSHLQRRDVLAKAARDFAADVKAARSLAVHGFRPGEFADGWTSGDRTKSAGIEIEPDGRYTMFVDRNGTTDGDEVAMATVELPPNVRITAPSEGQQIRFDPNGASLTSFSVVITDTERGTSRTILVSASGAVTIR
jgi:Tfp pilus assembly protein FimT